MSVDIMPTILALAGVALAPGDRMQGTSLVPWMVDGAPESPHAYVFAERARGSQTMVRSPRWKYIRTRDPVMWSSSYSRKPGTVELFDLRADEKELEDVSDRESEQAAAMEAVAEAWESQTVVARPAEPDALLEALGYIEE